MLAVRGVEVRYPSGIQALAGVDLELAGGQLCALVGANGSGKTTLLRVAASLRRPDVGEVSLFGERRASPRSIAARVAWIAQEPGLDPGMTGREHLELQAALMGLSRRASASRIAALVDELRLDALDRRVAGYSGGMRRRLHLALGLVHEPALLLLDEPTAGLDPAGQDAVWTLLGARVQAGCAALVVSHDLARVRAHASRVVFLDRGRIVGAGAPEQLAADHGGELLGAYTTLTGRDANALLGERERGRERKPGSGGGRRRAHG